MKKETLMIAFSNQKSGDGESTMTILLASYLHYVKNLKVAVRNPGFWSAQALRYLVEG